MNDPLQPSVSGGPSIESVLSTPEITGRPSRPPDYETERCASLKLVQRMADSPETALQAVAETALEVCRAGSAGISLISEQTGDFYWAAIAGAWRSYVGRGTLRHFGPCGVVFDRNAPQLFTQPGRYYPYMAALLPPAVEELIAPFYVHGKAAGALWVMGHDDACRFSAEDMRVVQHLAPFAAAGYLLTGTPALTKRASLHDVNQALIVSSIRQHELTDEARKAETEARESEGRLVAELRVARQLQEISTQLIRDGRIEALYGQILETAMLIMRCDMAGLQVPDQEGALRVLAFRGLDPELHGIVEPNLPEKETPSSIALREGRRVIVPDAETCPLLGPPTLEDYRKAGIRSAQATPLVSRGGRMLGVISTYGRSPCVPLASDLTLLDVFARQTADLMDRSQVERSLRKSEERFRTLMAVTADVTWTSDGEGRFVTPQPAWTACTGQTWDEAKGFGWSNALHPENRAALMEDWTRACRSRSPYRSSTLIWHAATRQYRHFETRAAPLFREDGSVREWVGSCTDVEEVRRAEERLRHAQRLESLGVLAGGIAHDFNNLLTGILGNASLAMGDLPPAHEAHPLLVNVVKAAQSAAKLTAQMLAYSGKGQFRLEPIDLSQVVRETIDLIRASIPKNVHLHLDLEPQLPAMQADASQIQQLIMNLVINGAEAIGEVKAGTVRIATQARDLNRDWIERQSPVPAGIEPGPGVSLEVQDTGSGMNEKTKARIFDPFFSTKFLGRGLGLAAALGIVQSHKGILTVDSVPGEGSTFRAWFPASSAHHAQRKPEPRASRKLSGGGSILVVDDEEPIRSLVRMLLEQHGLAVFLAENGQEAVEIFRQFQDRISVVLLDLTMPVLSGEETLNQLRALRPDVRVVLSSGYDRAETLRRFQGMDLAGFIQKPYTVSDLAETIDAALGKG